MVFYLFFYNFFWLDRDMLVLRCIVYELLFDSFQIYGISGAGGVGVRNMRKRKGRERGGDIGEMRGVCWGSFLLDSMRYGLVGGNAVSYGNEGRGLSDFILVRLYGLWVSGREGVIIGRGRGTWTRAWLRIVLKGGR